MGISSWNKVERKLLSLLLVLVMCISLMPVTAYADPADSAADWTAYAQEVEPDAEGNYEISTAAGLAWLAKSVNDGTLEQYSIGENGETEYITVRLTGDIDLSAHEWTPIGTDRNHAFRAVLEGQGHTITGMRVGSADAPYSAGYYAGLFGLLSGRVTDVKLTASAVYAAAPEGEIETYTGLIAGRMMDGDAAVIHCEAAGSVYTAGSTNNTGQYAVAGGIAGDNYDGLIDACRAEVILGALDAERYCSLGGIAANAGINRNAVIRNCAASMKVNPAVWKQAGTHADGMVVNASAKCTIINSIARADYAGTGLPARQAGTGKNVCLAEVNSESEASCRYIDAEGNVSNPGVEEMKAEAFVTTLNTAASAIEGAGTWKAGAEADEGFPVPDRAGSRVFYTAAFVSAGAAYDAKVAAEGETISAPADPVREGYNFLYWYGGDEGTAYDFSAPLTEDRTITAKWDPHIYAVTFDSRGGSYVYPQNVARDERVTEPDAPKKKGSAFGGWFTDPACQTAWNFDNAVTGDMTLYANWGEAPSLTVSGRITDAGTGDGIRGASVALDNGQNGTTDEFGYYRIYSVEQGSYTVTVEASGYQKASQAGFEVSGLSAGYDAALAPSGNGGAKTVNVYANVSCVYSGIMLSGVQVKAVGAGDLGTFTQTTDENGYALFTGLPEGSYTFEINQSGRPGWESYTSQAQELSGDYNLNCALKPRYQEMTVTVRGSFDPVTQTEGVPMAGVQVKAVGVDPKNEDKELVSLSAETDENGVATFDKLVPITWKISSSAFAYTETETTVYSNGAGKLSKTAVELTLPFEGASLTVGWNPSTRIRIFSSRISRASLPPSRWSFPERQAP